MERALKIHGVKIRPAWNWTKEYKRHVTEVLGRNDWLTHNEQCERMAEKYARWMAERDGIDLSRANRVICHWHHGNGRQLRYGWNGKPAFASKKIAVESVEFQDAQPPRMYQREWECKVHEVIATIELPWSASQPAVIELDEDEAISA